MPLICTVLLLPCFCYGGLIGKTYPDGKVTKILKVDSGGEFRCKISGRSLIAGASLRVHTRGINCHKDNAEAKAYLENAIKQAKSIRLKNIRLRNYFRVIADVEIDGKDLAGELVKLGHAKPLKKSTLNTNAVRTSDYLKKNKTVTKTKTRPLAAKTSDNKTTARTADTKDSQIKNAINNNQLVLGGKGFYPEMTFEDAIDQVRNSVKPELPIVVLWPDLERNCFVHRDTPIGIEWNGKIAIRKALDILLMGVAQTDGLKLQYYVDGGIITVASTKIKLAKKEMRVYNVAELTAASAMMNQGRYGQGMYGNQGYGYGNQGYGYGNQGMYGSQRYGNQGTYGNNRYDRSNRNNRSSRNNRRNTYRR